MANRLSPTIEDFLTLRKNEAQKWPGKKDAECIAKQIRFTARMTDDPVVVEPQPTQDGEWRISVFRKDARKVLENGFVGFVRKGYF